jgi:parallel beta-helix repeat protein
MSRRLVYLLISAVVLSFLSTLRSDFTASATTVTVPTDFPTIQVAINNVDAGDTILVGEGIYPENVVVNKSVSIVGENKDTTIIEGGDSGVVVRIIADNVSLSGFTVQNSGAETYGNGVLIQSNFNNVSGNIITENGLTGICLNNSFGSLVSENTIRDNDGDGVFLVGSSKNVLFNNLVTRNNGGIRLYSSNENNISRNIVTNDLLGGIYLFYSSNNSLFDNVMCCNKNYGLNLDFSSDINRIFDNIIVNNLKHGLVLGSVSGNILRNNNMTGNQFNFYAVLSLPNLQDYLNDVDPSNIVDGKEIHYIISRKDLVINSISYPNIGYLALVNSTRITVKGLNLTDNGQALLLAFTSNSTLENLRASDNDHGIQLCSSSHISIRNCAITNNSADGVTIDHSSLNNTVIENVIAGNKLGIRVVHFCRNNTISINNVTNNDRGMLIFSYASDNIVTNNVITHNRIGISLKRESPNKIIGNTIANNDQGILVETSGNLIYHNNFVNNTVQVETPYASSIWDLGYSSGGNYWSDYEDEDTNDDGIGDIPYVIDENNVDRYPLVSLWTQEDKTPPAIGFPTCFPSDNIQPYEKVAVCVAVTDMGSGLKNVTLFYTIDNGSSWVDLKMAYNSTAELFIAVLRGQPLGTLVRYKIVACDRAGNVAVKDNSGQFFSYQVIPEFGSMCFLLSFVSITVFILLIVKTFHRRKT